MTPDPEALNEAARQLEEAQERRRLIEVEYEQLSGKKFWTNPVCHGNRAFASWEFQVWLEDELVKARAAHPEWNARPSLPSDTAMKYEISLRCNKMTTQEAQEIVNYFHSINEVGK